ncbi:MAG: hypothetical protein Q7S40_26690 [Opitutaceae bacterium]|nr:hypothetical protein [Opitutaceae bacterium]
MKRSSYPFRLPVVLSIVSLCVANLAFAADNQSRVAFTWNPEKANSANAAIMAYLGDPVPPPAVLDPKYTPEGLVAAFRTLCRNVGFEVKQIAIDDTEFPFLVYGIIEGRQSYQKIKDGLAAMSGYAYAGSSTGSTGSGSTHFSLNMVPNSAYPRSQADAIRRRTMIRLQMLAAIWTDQ